jgi:hypothetical protein
MNCHTVDVYWNYMTAVVAPVVAALSHADETMKERIKDEVYQAVNKKYPDGHVLIDSSSWIIYGEK